MGNAKLGERIKNCRLRLGKNQEEFGKMLTPPAAKNSVSQWEHGRNKPNKQRLKEIAKLCDATVRDLVGNGPMLTEKQKNCPYCRPDEETTRMYHKVRPDTKRDKMAFCKGHGLCSNCIGYDDQKYFFCSLENVYGYPISYCPVCGRPLNEEGD